MNAMTMPWVEICALGDIPARGCRVVQIERGQIAVFRTADDAVFALENRCPHKGGPLSEGIVHGRWVTCPLHNWVIGLAILGERNPDRLCELTLIELRSGSGGPRPRRGREFRRHPTNPEVTTPSADQGISSRNVLAGCVRRAWGSRR